MSVKRKSLTMASLGQPEIGRQRRRNAGRGNKDRGKSMIMLSTTRESFVDEQSVFTSSDGLHSIGAAGEMSCLCPSENSSQTLEDSQAKGSSKTSNKQQNKHTTSSSSSSTSSPTSKEFKFKQRPQCENKGIKYHGPESSYNLGVCRCRKVEPTLRLARREQLLQ